MASSWGTSWGTSWASSWDGAGAPPVVEDDEVYWGLLRKKIKRERLKPIEAVETVEPVQTVELEPVNTQSAMQLALQKAMLEKQAKRQLDQFIDGLASKAGQEQAARIAAEDHQIATLIAMLL